MFGFPGHWELLLIALIILLLFGSRLPSVMRNLGRGVTEFKRGIQGVEDDIEDAANKPAVTENKPAENESTEEAKQKVDAD